MADQAVSELRVQPERVINILKARLAEEQTKSAIMEAALQESQERERALLSQVAKMAAAADQPKASANGKKEVAA